MNFKAISTSALILFSTIGFVVFIEAGPCSKAEVPKKSSSIEISSTKQGDQLKLTFKTVPASDMVINEDGPWKLELKKAEGMTFSKDKFDKKEIDFAIPGYTVLSAGKPASNKGSFGWKMIVFVCTKDKATCVRDVHEGTYTWKL